MAKKDDFDLDEEVEKLGRKTNIKARRAEYAFENQLRQLDAEMNSIVDRKIKEFDEQKAMYKKYSEADFTTPTIDRYRRKLNKI